MEKVEVGREVFGAGKLPALHTRWALVWALGLSGDFDSGADGDEIVELDHVGIP
jgi:hypothetical protein